MKVGNVLTVLVLTCVWILLRESFTIATVISGLIFSALTLIFCKKALPIGKVTDIRFSKLAMYPLFLIGQVYVAGVHVVKLIFTEASAEIIKVKTNIKNESLRILLVDSITLTPGSTFVRMEGDELIILWLKGKDDDKLSPEERDDFLKGSLERLLIKAEK